MTVIIAQDSPDAIRGILKRWFIEPKPQVFVDTINRSVRSQVIDYIRQNAQGIRLLIIHSASNAQGFIIEQINDPDRSLFRHEGFYLIAAPQSNPADYPF